MQNDALTHRGCLTLTVRGSPLVVETDVCRRQTLTTKVDPRTVRVKIFLMAEDS